MNDPGRLADGRYVPCMSDPDCQNYECLAVRTLDDGSADPLVELSIVSAPGTVLAVRRHELEAFIASYSPAAQA